MSYTYLLDQNAYRDDDSGEVLSAAELRGYMQDIADAGADQAAMLAEDFITSEGTVSTFMVNLRLELKTTYIQQYILGRGGRSQMKAADWGSVGRMLRLAYRDLRKLQIDIETKTMSLAEVRRRSRLHFQKSREAFERGNAKAFGLPTLPAYPGDLSSECQAGDRCHWRIMKLAGNGNFDVFWETDFDAESCDTCVERHGSWYPLHIQNGILMPFTMIRAEAHEHSHPLAVTVDDELSPQLPVVDQVVYIEKEA